MEINPGGIGKGYAVDRMVEILRRKGIERALVMASSSSIYGLGAPPDEARGWKVDIRHPQRPREHSATEVFLKDLSLSSSGGYAQRFVADGRTFSHIMDPRTGYPAQGMLLVSVTAPRTIDSEAWAKPCFIQGGLGRAAPPETVQRIFLRRWPRTGLGLAEIVTGSIPPRISK